MTYVCPGTPTDFALATRECCLAVVRSRLPFDLHSGRERGAFRTQASGSMAVDDTGLAEIAVTVQQYKSTIQDTPISISALSGEQLIDARH